MKFPTRTGMIGVAVAASLLALPAGASAHGSLFQITAKSVPSGLTPTLATTQGDLTSTTQYVVTNHGYTFVLRESNGLTDHGFINYKVLPGAYRNAIKPTDPDRILSEGDTGAQPHATCRGVAALETGAAIRSWQGGESGDPFYNYVPFQKNAAGLEDTPSTWIEQVQSRTGVNLNDIPNGDPATVPAVATALTTACSGIGGTFTAADATATTAAALNSGTIHDVQEPLDAEIASLEAEKSSLEAEIASLQAAKNAAEASKADAEARATEAERAKQVAEEEAKQTKTQADAYREESAKLALTYAPLKLSAKAGVTSVAALRASGLSVNLEGPSLQKVAVQLVLRKRDAEKLGLTSEIIGSATTAFGANARTEVRISTSKKAAAALKRLRTSLPLIVAAASGGREVTTSLTLNK